MSEKTVGIKMSFQLFSSVIYRLFLSLLFFFAYSSKTVKKIILFSQFETKEHSLCVDGRPNNAALLHEQTNEQFPVFMFAKRTHFFSLDSSQLSFPPLSSVLSLLPNHQIKRELLNLRFNEIDFRLMFISLGFIFATSLLLLLMV